MRKPKTAEFPDTPKPEQQSAPLAWIDVPEDRARSFNPDEAAGLAAIIAATGLQHPIRVRIVGNRYRLVAGRKRLEAARLLGWDAISCTVSSASTDDEARLEEVMENLGRYDLNKLDRSQHLYELKQVYERLRPEARNGGDRKSEIRRQNLPSDPESAEQIEIFGFSSSVAEKIGMSDRAIRLAVKIWTDLTPASRLRLAGSRFADHQSALKELSEQSSDDQVKVLDMLLSEPPFAATVAEAVQVIRSGVVLTHAEKKAATVSKTLKALPETAASSLVAAQVDARISELKKNIATLSRFFGDLKDDELDSVIDQNEERVIASLKRRGRI